MSNDQQNVSRSRDAKKHLILSEINVRSSLPPLNDQEAAIASVDGEALFLEKALSLLENHAVFGFMIIQVDNISDILNTKNVITTIEGVIQKTVRKTGGICQMTGKGIFSCVLPDADADKCRKTAETLSKRISRHGSETVSVGIAVYPTLAYEKKEIFENARKALAHGAFFGARSVVSFDAVSLNISGDNYYQAGNIDAAMAEYELALALDPTNVNVHNSIGVCHGDRGNSELALESFEKAMSLDPADAFAIYNAGYIYMQKNEFDTALDYFKRAMEIEKNIFELLFQTGRALYELGRPEEALSYLNSAILENPAPGGMVYRYMGDCSLALGQPDNAIKSYNTALKLRPDDAHSLSAVALCYENENRNPEIALMFGENAVEIQPENGLYRHRLAMMYMSRGLHNEALEQFKKAAQCGHEASINNIDAARDLAEQNTRQKKISG